MFVEILVLLASIILVLVQFLTWHYGYWKKRGVPHDKPQLLFGNIKDVFLKKRSFIGVLSDLYDKFNGYKYFGAYFGRNPVIIIRDGELAKSVLIRDFNSFHDNSIRAHPEADPLFERNPFTQRGENWRTVRTQLTPLLTMGKVKNMFESMSVVCTRFKNHIDKNIDTYSKGIDFHLLAQQYTVENFALNGLTINANAFEDMNNDFRKIAYRLFTVDDTSTLIAILLMVIDPKLAYMFRQKLVRTSEADYFRSVVNDVLKYRIENGINHNDYFDQVRQLTSKHPGDEQFLPAQIFTLFIDGVETSASAMRSVIYELAANPSEFKKVREEIDEVLSRHKHLTYDAIQDMKYLDCSFQEALRINTPVVFLLRNCTVPYKMPPQKGTEEGLLLEEDTIVVIPLHLLHNDSDIFDDPEKYKPERFNDSSTSRIHMPFGEGPRQCLGTRYAVQQIKMALITLIQNYDFELNDKTIYPCEIAAGTTFFHVPNEPVITNIHKRGTLFK